VLAPIFAKLLVIEFFIESMAVRIPTRAVIPTAMIRIVRIVRSRFERIDLKAIFKFSLKS
jgi:hypothetical protein